MVLITSHLMIVKHRRPMRRALFLRFAILPVFENFRKHQALNLIHSLISVIPICAHFSEKHRICGKHENILDQGSKYIAYQHVNIQQKSYNKLNKMLYEYSQCTPFNTCDTTGNCNKYGGGNHRDASIG